MVEVLTDSHISPQENVEKIVVSADNVLYETLTARAGSRTSINWDIESKGDNSYLDSTVYCTAYFLFSKEVNGVNATNAQLDERDQFCLRNNFHHDIMLNSTFNYNGTNINSRPYLTTQSMNAVCCDNFYLKKYDGVGGSRSNHSYVDTFNNRPDRGQLLRAPITGATVGDLVESFRPYYNTDSSNNDVADGSSQVLVNANAYDSERFNKINWFLDLLRENASNTETVNDKVYTRIPITFPLQIAPFKLPNINSHWYNGMSSALPYVKNSSLNLQLKQEILGLAMEIYNLDSSNRTGVNKSAQPDFITDRDNTNSKIFFQVSPTKNWELHLRWFQQNDVPAKSSYSLSTYRCDNFIKAMSTIDPAPNTTTVVSQTVTTDLAKVAEKPTWILFQAVEDVISNNSRGSDTENQKYRNDQGFLKAGNIQIKNLQLSISNRQGVLTSNVSEEALMNYTKNYVCKNFNIAQKEFKLFRNFVLLKTDDLAGSTPPGIFQNCNIRATATFGYNPYTTANLPSTTKIPYNLVMTFIYDTDILEVSDQGVILKSQGSDISQLDRININVVGNAYTPMRGVSSNYQPY